MPQLARVHDDQFDSSVEVEFVALPRPATVIAPWGDDAAAADSPARQLHQRLIESFEAPAPAEWKLPLRTRLAVVTGAILLPWVLTAAVALAL